MKSIQDHAEKQVLLPTNRWKPTDVEISYCHRQACRSSFIRFDNFITRKTAEEGKTKLFQRFQLLSQWKELVRNQRDDASSSQKAAVRTNIKYQKFPSKHMCCDS